MILELNKSELKLLIDSVYTEKCYQCKNILSTQNMKSNAKTEEEKAYFERVEKNEKERLIFLDRIYDKLVKSIVINKND